jgi:hypothetical protein
MKTIEADHIIGSGRRTPLGYFIGARDDKNPDLSWASWVDSAQPETTPRTDGHQIADAILAEPDWQNVRLVLRHVHPERLISSFFSALFARVLSQAPERVKDLPLIEWDARYPFQRENIARSLEEIPAPVMGLTQSPGTSG